MGQGSEFALRLPLPAAPPVVAAPPARRQPQPGERAGKVLVIDDNADAADTLAMVLEMLGCSVGTAYDGPSGLTLAAAFEPDVVLLDIGLPHMNGYEVARRLRDLPCGRDAILVAVTGWGQDKDRQLASRGGL